MTIVAWGETPKRIRKTAGAHRNCPICVYNSDIPPEYVRTDGESSVVVGEGWIRSNCTDWYDADRSHYETTVIQKKDIPPPLDKLDRAIIAYTAEYPIGQSFGVIVRRNGEIYHHGVPLDILKKRRRISERVPSMDIIQWVSSQCNEAFADTLDMWCNEAYYSSGVPTGLRYVIIAAFRTFDSIVTVVKTLSSYYATAVYENECWELWWGKPFYTPIGRIDVYERAIFVNDKLLPTQLYPHLWYSPELVRLWLNEL